MPASKTQAIHNAKHLLKQIRHAAVATVNSNGSPHNTPLYYLYDEALNFIYWCSSPSSQHSKNISYDGRIFLVIYGAESGGGLYIEADRAHILNGSDIKNGLMLVNEHRLSEGKKALSPSNFSGDSPQRIYAAEPKHFYVNHSQRDADGNIIKDIRSEITRADLI